MKRSKLNLKSQTIRTLTSRQLRTAGAGEGAISLAWCSTHDCPSDGYSCTGTGHD